MTKANNMVVYLKYSEERNGGQICEGQEHDDWPSHEDEIIDWTPLSLHTDYDNDDYVESIICQFSPEEHVGETIYMPVIRYSDGGTFGRTCGYWVIPMAYLTREEAQKDLDIMSDKDYYDQLGIRGRIKKYPAHLPYPNWFGYFGNLESAEVLKMVLEK